jgi:hypothetical protein
MVQQHQKHSTENENGDRDQGDGNRHGYESDCAGSTSDGSDGDCEKDGVGVNETSHAAGYGQSRDSCNRGIETTLRRRRKGKKMRREDRASETRNDEKREVER